MSDEDEKQKPSEFVFETSESEQNPSLEGLAGLDLNLGQEPVLEGAAAEIAAEFPLSEPAPAGEAEAAPPAEAAVSDPTPAATPAPAPDDAPKVEIPAAFPFSLSVVGRLTPGEQEKLLDVLSRENIGVRELDLETQLQAGRILIPRISEYAGVLLVQALRGASVEIKLLPSDLGELLETPTAPATEANPAAPDLSHPAEQITVTQTENLPGLVSFEVIGIMSTSAILRSEAIEAENSKQYADLLESLTREMKYKAFRKGAVGIVKFQVELTPLRTPSDYRLTLTGTAVKPASPSGLNAENPSI